MLTTGLRVFKEVNERTSSAVDEAHLPTRKTIIQYITAIELESQLMHNKEQAKAILEMHYDFNLDNERKKVDSYLTIQLRL